MNWDSLTGQEFEQVCAEILRKNGFEHIRLTKGSGDQGVDIIANRDGVRFAIQCKRWANPLGNTPVQEVYSGKAFYDCDAAIVMTNSTFTKGAIELAKKTEVLLWDRSQLQRLSYVDTLMNRFKDNSPNQKTDNKPAEPTKPKTVIRQILGVGIDVQELLESIGVKKSGDQIERTNVKILIKKVRELTNADNNPEHARLIARFVSDLISEFNLQVVDPKGPGCFVSILKLWGLIIVASIVFGMLVGIFGQ